MKAAVLYSHKFHIFLSIQHPQFILSSIVATLGPGMNGNFTPPEGILQSHIGDGLLLDLDQLAQVLEDGLGDPMDHFAGEIGRADKGGHCANGGHILHIYFFSI